MENRGVTNFPTASPWNPNQYELFKRERSQPFFDLLALVDAVNLSKVIDLGCGTGELTRELHRRTGALSTLGIDSSPAMLSKAAAFPEKGLQFVQRAIEAVLGNEAYDLVFSNAALQWVKGHETLFPRLLSLTGPAGQVAIQMPYNFDHPSHALANKIILSHFSSVFSPEELESNVLTPERYAVILSEAGFMNQICRLEVYLHPLPSALEVVEWTKGSLLTKFKSRLSNCEYADMLEIYEKELLTILGEGPVLYTFKRILLWGKKGQ